MVSKNVESMMIMTKIKNKIDKGICIKCKNEDKLKVWTSKDDANWNKGFVECPRRITKVEGIFGSTAGVDYDIPEYCPYKFEHSILSQDFGMRVIRADGTEEDVEDL